MVRLKRWRRDGGRRWFGFCARILSQPFDIERCMIKGSSFLSQIPHTDDLLQPAGSPGSIRDLDVIFPVQQSLVLRVSCLVLISESTGFCGIFLPK